METPNSKKKNSYFIPHFSYPIFEFALVTVSYCFDKNREPKMCWFEVSDMNNVVFSSQHFPDNQDISEKKKGNRGLHDAWKATMRFLSKGESCDRILGSRVISETR